MTAPYSPGYNPYSSNELDELERQRQLLSGQAPPPSALATDPMAGIGYDQTMAPEPVAAPAPTTAVQPFDLASAPAALRKGMGTSSVTTQGIPEAERQRLESAHAQLTGGRLNQIDAAGAAERDVASRGLGEANARGIESANQEVYKQRAIDDSQRKQAELRKAQDEWTAKKEDGSALNALGGNELAATLTSIGIAAGVFSQAMGWQNGNPVKDMLDKSIDRSVAAQREQKNSRLNVLAARLGDEKAAEAQVRGELHDATATRIAAQMQGTQHQDALDRLGPLMQDQQLKAQQAQAEAAERLAPKQSVTQTPVKVGGGIDPIERAKKVAEAAKALEGAGASKEAIAKMFQSAGLDAPTGKTAAELERDDKAAAATAKAKELTTDEKKDLRERTDGLATAVHGFEELDQVAGIARDGEGNVVHARTDLNETLSPGVTEPLMDAAKSLPWNMGSGVAKNLKASLPPDSLAMRRSAEKIVSGMLHAESGAGVNEGEIARAQERLPVNSSSEFVRASEELHREQRQKYLNLTAKYGQENVDADLRARGIDPARFAGTKPADTTPAGVKEDMTAAEDRQKSGRRETEFEKLERLHARMPK